MEFVSYGTMRNFLQTQRDRLVSDPELQSLFTIASYHIALAMEHIRSKMVTYSSIDFHKHTKDIQSLLKNKSAPKCTIHIEPCLLKKETKLRQNWCTFTSWDMLSCFLLF